jgi:Fic family protein
LLKIARIQQYKTIKICGISLVYILTDKIQSQLHFSDKNAAGNVESDLDVIKNISRGDIREKYIISSFMEEAIASSQLEGAATTRKVAKELLKLNLKPRNTSEQMIVNNFNTMQKIRGLLSEKLSPSLLLELQSSITYNTIDENDIGKFRDNNDIVVADPLESDIIYHRPPSYEKIEKLIDELCDFINTDEEDNFVHPLIKGIVVHFLIGYIHPFNDGNGRTARTIFYWYMLKQGYWLFEFMSVSRIILRNKAKYGMAYLYTETDDMDLTYFINYNLNAIDEAVSDMKTYIVRKQKEQTQALNMMRQFKFNTRQADILKEFTKSPEKNFFLNEIKLTYGVVYETARSDLGRLEKLGYIEKINLGRKFAFRLRKKDNGLKET